MITRFLGAARLGLTMAAGLHAGAAFAQQGQPLSPDAKGVWIDHTGRGAVEIVDCGGKLCGSVVWLKDNKNVKACGIQIIGNVPQLKPGVWDGGGWIYDPEENAKYSVEISLAGADKLKILGYAGVKLFGETMYWTRAPAGLPRCKAQVG